MLYLPASNGSEEVADDSILVIREVAMLYVWPQIVEPPQPAALAAPLQPCNARSFFRYTKPSWLNNASRHACYYCLCRTSSITCFVRESNPVAAGAILVDVLLELAVLLG